ncbi:hypothetical protein LCGC14_2345170 [marine sediment metagenome]|uniref:Uncharacterized protein n=1 Tax=marine sediment metagenome TaxID=412755 RepID=A0A0F9CBM6_9ZZZZ
MAPVVNCDLGAVVEKARLPAATEFTFMVRKAELGPAKNINKNTGKIEDRIACEVFPLDAGWEDRIVYQNWSLSPRALESDSPTFSIKKFFTVVGFNVGPQWSTEDLLTIKFVATVKYKEGDNRPQLDKVLRGA